MSRCFPRLRAAFYSVAALVVLARFLNGMHYLSDVLVGAAFGLLVARAVFGAMMRSRRLWRKRRSGPTRSAAA